MRCRLSWVCSIVRLLHFIFRLSILIKHKLRFYDSWMRHVFLIDLVPEATTRRCRITFYKKISAVCMQCAHCTVYGVKGPLLRVELHSYYYIITRWLPQFNSIKLITASFKELNEYIFVNYDNCVASTRFVIFTHALYIKRMHNFVIILWYIQCDLLEEAEVKKFAWLHIRAHTLIHIFAVI